jgi:hypothetical protein
MRQSRRLLDLQAQIEGFIKNLGSGEKFYLRAFFSWRRGLLGRFSAGQRTDAKEVLEELWAELEKLEELSRRILTTRDYCRGGDWGGEGGSKAGGGGNGYVRSTKPSGEECVKSMVNASETALDESLKDGRYRLIELEKRWKKAGLFGEGEEELGCSKRQYNSPTRKNFRSRISNIEFRDITETARIVEAGTAVKLAGPGAENK